MAPEEALSVIRSYAISQRVEFTEHALFEASEAGATVDDVMHALVNARNIRRSSSDQASDWSVDGPDYDGDDLTVAVLFQGNLLVITVF